MVVRAYCFFCWYVFYFVGFVGSCVILKGSSYNDVLGFGKAMCVCGAICGCFCFHFGSELVAWD